MDYLRIDRTLPDTGLTQQMMLRTGPVVGLTFDPYPVIEPRVVQMNPRKMYPIPTMKHTQPPRESLALLHPGSRVFKEPRPPQRDIDFSDRFSTGMFKPDQPTPLTATRHFPIDDRQQAFEELEARFKSNENSKFGQRSFGSTPF
jgi:hypothetical protein